MKLKLFMRKLQMYDEYQKPVWYNGLNPNSLNIIPGYLPNNEWKEYTDYVDNLDELTMIWKVKKNDTSKSISNIEKSVSNELQLFGKAFDFVQEWLNNHPAAPLNGIEVMIEIVGSGNIIDLVIKNNGITYCDDDYCNIEVNLKQKDDLYSCIYSTLITDNHLSMFDGKYQHPRFSYCNEFRPTSLLTTLFTIMSLVSTVIIFVYAILYPVIMAVTSAINVIVGVIRTIQKLLFVRKSKRMKYIKFSDIPTPSKIRDAIVEMYVDLVGCGREHPAPLIRDYITNVCSKCGVTITQDSIPIFFNPSSKYYNLTMLSAEVKKGIDKDNNDNYWIKDNDPLLTLDMLLNKLQPLFNAKWFIKNNILYFDRKDKFENNTFLFDFNNTDKKEVVNNICYTWNENKSPAYLRIGYSIDAFDNLTSDCQKRYNDIVEFNNPINPILEGEKNSISTDFAPTRFRNDGVYRDYVSDIFSPLGIISIFFGGLDRITISKVEKRMKEFKYSVIMQNHTTTLPKLIIWDGKSKKSAKALKELQYNTVNMPSPNDRYNTKGIPYQEIHNDDFRKDPYYNENNWLINYPMFFDAMFKGNLYDFHEIDDPRVTPPINKNFDLAIPLCDYNLKKLDLFNSSGNINLDRKVKVNGGTFYQDGIIEEIELNFNSKNNLGKHIKIKGRI